jgi:hypothetical protein
MLRLSVRPRPLPADHFNLRTGDKDMQYSLIINAIIDELEKDKPKTMEAVRQMIDNLRNPNSFYGLLVGEIQAGKTPAQMILTWIFSRHPEFRGSVCFVTKNLDSIRRDIMGKFNSDLINRHIISVCARYGISATDAIRQFGLTYHIYTDNKTVKLGLAGQVEIMLMQKDNFSHVRRWYSEISQHARAAPILFLVDEMHEMYGGASDLVANNGLSDAKKIGNIGMLHWFQKKCQERRCYLIGVTATPYAPMSADPICWPTRLYRLTTDAPAQGLTYYGYVNHQLCPQINIGTYDPTNLVDMNAIYNIISRPRTILANGNTEVTFLCLTHLQYNQAHEDAAYLIKEQFGDAVDILVFNQTNDIPLSQWFRTKMLTKSVCKSGAIIIIGRACMAAGITVKPTKPLMAEHDGVTYQVTGITDQLMPDSKINVSAMKQLMRILGWFPDGHSANLWLPSDELHPVYQTEIGDVSRQFMEKYDVLTGPASIGEITLTSKYIKSFFNGNPYKTDQRYGTHLYTSQEFPEDLDELPVDYVNIDTDLLEDAGIDLNRTIESFGGQNGEQRTLRMALGFQSGDRYQIGYSEARYDNILKAALSPKEHDTTWQVNGFLWGPKGFQSKLKDCCIVTFQDSWDDRETNNVTFQTPDGNWHYIQKTKCMTHKFLTEFTLMQNPTDIRPNSLSEEHHRILEMLDEIAAEAKAGRPLNSWSLFVKCYKIVHGTGSSEKCAEPYASLKAQFISICNSNMSDYEKLKAGQYFLRKPAPIRINIRPRLI